MQNGPAGVRLGRLIDLRFEPTGETLIRGRIGPGHTGRRHGARPQLADYLFPDFGLGRNLVEVHVVQREAAGLESLVVAGDAIFVEQRTLGIGGPCRASRYQAQPCHYAPNHHLYEKSTPFFACNKGLWACDRICSCSNYSSLVFAR